MGSFFNVCIHRIPKGESIIYPPSHCPNCNMPLKFYDNIPIMSYIFLKGKCRYCGTRISPTYPIVEFLTGFLYFLSYMYFGKNLWIFISSTVFISFLIIITFIDLRHMIIPDIVVYPAITIGLLISLFKGYEFLFDSVLGGIIGGFTIFLIIFLSRGGMGIGDIKLATMIGIFLGVNYIIMALILSFIIGGFIGIFLLLLKIKKRKDPIPFGPFLSIGAILSLFWGNIIGKIWGWY